MYHDELDGRGIYSHSDIDTLLKIQAPAGDIPEGAYGWDDVSVSGDFVKLPASSAPTPTTWKTNFTLQSFATVGGEYVQFTVQLPHDRMPGADLHWHVHFLPVAEIPSGETVSFRLNCVAMTPTAVAPAAALYTTSYTAAGAVAADTHCITTSAVIPGAALGASSILVCRLYRYSVDTFLGNVLLLSTDFHCKKSRLGSGVESGVT